MQQGSPELCLPQLQKNVMYLWDGIIRIILAWYSLDPILIEYRHRKLLNMIILESCYQIMTDTLWLHFMKEEIN